MPVVHVTWGAESNVATFGGDTLGAQPSGWTRRWGSSATWEVVDDASSADGQSLQGSTTSNGRHLLSWDAVGTPSDVEVLSLLRSDTDATDVGGVNATNQNRLYTRAGGSEGSEYAVFVGLTGGDDIVKVEYYTAGSTTRLASPAFSWTAGDRIMIRFRVEASSVKVKAWIPADAANPTSDEPAAWLFEGTQSSVLGGGHVGVGFYSQPGVRTFEWVSFATDGATAGVPS